MLVVSLGGSPSQRSRSGVLLERSQRWLQEQGVEVVSYQVRDFPAEDLLHARFDSPKVIDLLQQIENADGLLIATPVYKASFSGALKTVLDLLPERALAHKVVLPMATGGSIAHMLAVVRNPLLGEAVPGHSFRVLAIMAVVGWVFTLWLFTATRRRIVHYL